MQSIEAVISSPTKVVLENRSEQNLSCRERYLRACACQGVDRPPIWMMRQAGRALPEYRKLKENFTFLELVKHPHLAAEVTLQPIRRFGFDAAILFSDILVIPEAMGQRYFFRETGGIEMEYAMRSIDDICRLEVNGIRERLAYVHGAIQCVRRELGSERALIGFAGSPWTLANFMLDGGSSKQHTAALSWMEHRPHAFRLLMEKLTEAVTEYLRMQVAAGVDAIQIFDTLGGLLPAKHFRAASGDWLQQIVGALDNVVPVTVFAKGSRNWEDLVRTGANVIGIDQDIRLPEATSHLPNEVAVQGNLNPEFLLGEPEAAAAETRRLISQMEGHNGWIFNLGHGVPPAARLETISAVVETIRA